MEGEGCAVSALEPDPEQAGARLLCRAWTGQCWVGLEGSGKGSVLCRAQRVSPGLAGPGFSDALSCGV